MTAMKLQRQVLATAFVLAFGGASANPTGPGVSRGAALLSNPSLNVLQIINTPGAIINWQSFSINVGETTRFVQLDRTSAVLNRVTGNLQSNIFGRLESNGRIVLVNPNGMVFGNGAVIDVAGLIASTRDITDANFVAGNYLFQGTGAAGIDVQSGATITTATAGNGGHVWLIAKNVNLAAGSQITTPQGQVVVAAGTELQVGTSALGNMAFNVTTDGASNISSLGAITAERGAVGMFADSITHGGTINAKSDGGVRGMVTMNATMGIKLQSGAVVNTDGLTTGRGGMINLSAGRRLEISPLATVSADGGPAGGDGGSISLTSTDIDIGVLPWLTLNIHAATQMFGFAEGTVAFNTTGMRSYALQGPTIIEPSGVNGSMKITSLAEGGFVAFWGDTQFPSNLYVQRFGPTGAALGSKMQLSSVGEYPSSVTPLAGGGFVTVSIGNNVDYVRVFDANGAQVGATINLPGLLFNETPGVFALSNGGFSLWGYSVLFEPRDATGAVITTNSSGVLPIAQLPRGIFVAQPADFQRYDAALVPIGSSSSDLGGLKFGGAVGGGAVFGPTCSNCSPPGGAVFPLSSGQSVSIGSVGGQLVAQPSVIGGNGLGSGVFLPTGSAGFGVGIGGGGFATVIRQSNGAIGVQAITSAPASFSPGTVAGGELPTVSGLLAPAPPPPPPPANPTVVQGNPNGGATFGGVGGCNASVCDPAVAAARAAAEAERAALNASQNAASPATAASAVRALQAAAQANQTAAGTNPVQPGLVIRDFGEMQRLMTEIGEFYATATPAEIQNTAAAAKKVIDQFLERETLIQQLGVDPANPNEVRQVDMILNMDAAQRKEYFEKIVTDMQLGTN